MHLGPELAQGAEGAVLLGQWQGRQVAVKRFKISQSDDLVRFRSELATLSQLQHPHVMPVLGARALPPDYFLVMPLARSSLHAMLYQQGWRPSLHTVLHIALQLSDALAYIHAQGMVHRDIKPSNVMEAPEGVGVWLSDFGLAVTEQHAVDTVNITQSNVRARGKPTGG
jgi:serine/threonine protein kinase